MKTKRLFLMLALLMTAVAGAWADGIVCSVNDIGKVICTDGSVYKLISDAESAGKTPVAMIAYVNGGKGLAISLHPIEKEVDYVYWGRTKVPLFLSYDASGENNEGKTAKQWAEEWNTTMPVTNATWRLPYADDWVNMIVGCGGESFSFDDDISEEGNNLYSTPRNLGNIDVMLQALSPEITITTYHNLKSGEWESSYGVGTDCTYWTATFSDIRPGKPYEIDLDRRGDWYSYCFLPWSVDNERNVRPCLAFNVIDPTPVTGLTLDKTSASVITGEAVALTATITPDDASDKRVTWTTADASVKFYADAECTVPTGGLTNLLTIYVQGTAAGTATVTVTSYSDPTKTASCQVTVSNPAVTLSQYEDNSAFVKAHDGQAYDVTLVRTLKAGVWNMFSVPFNVNHEQMLSVLGENAQVKTLRWSEYNEGKLSFTLADAWQLSVGLPYVVKVESDVVNPVFENVVFGNRNITLESPYIDFVPVVNPLTLTEGPQPDILVFFGNKMTNPVGSSTIFGFSSYFKLKGGAVSVSDIEVGFGGESGTKEVVTKSIGKATTEKPGDNAKAGEVVTTESGITYVLSIDDTVNPEDGSITMTATMTADEMKKFLEASVPGWSALYDAFKGIYFLLSAGKGKVEVDIETMDAGSLAALIGLVPQDDYTLDGKGTLTFTYEVTEDTWMFIFPVIKSGDASARSYRAPAEPQGSVKIYGIRVIPEDDNTGIKETFRSMAGNGHIYNINGQRVNTLKKGLYIIDGRKMVVK